MIARITAAAAIALALCPVHASAEDRSNAEWIFIGEDQKGAVGYVRRQDVMAGRPNQTAARVWMKLDASRDRTVAFREAFSLIEVNCPAQTTRDLQITLYYPDGSVKTQQMFGASEYIIPGSNAEVMAKMVCSSKPNFEIP